METCQISLAEERKRTSSTNLASVPRRSFVRKERVQLIGTTIAEAPLFLRASVSSTIDHPSKHNITRNERWETVGSASFSSALGLLSRMHNPPEQGARRLVRASRAFELPYDFIPIRSIGWFPVPALRNNLLELLAFDFPLSWTQILLYHAHSRMKGQHMLKWVFIHEHFVNNDRKAVGISLCGVGSMPNDLWSHILVASSLSRHSSIAVNESGKSKIGEQALVRFGEKNISRLDIPVNDIFLMQVLDCLSQTDRDAVPEWRFLEENLGLVECPCQIPIGSKIHDQRGGDRISSETDPDKSNNVRMLQLRQKSHLDLHAPKVLLQNLHRIRLYRHLLSVKISFVGNASSPTTENRAKFQILLLQ
mmetsp:Transcript_21454/g.31215  ORF Transcript_21454/g.31215 Transcript_21454/m.31215 type:complete len:364 (-) Transcript_21454:82-1173(-)